MNNKVDAFTVSEKSKKYCVLVLALLELVNVHRFEVWISNIRAVFLHAFFHDLTQPL